MSTTPVTLDFSKAQPLQAHGGVTLDFSKAQPLDQTSQPTTPPNSFAGQWNPQTQKWEDVEPETVQSQPPAERFARSFNKGITGAEDPTELWGNLKDMAAQIASDPAGATNPEALASKIVTGMYAGMKQTWDRAAIELKNGNITSKEGLLNYVDGFIHAAESGIPAVGPMLANADQELASGNVAGAAGTATAAATPFVAGAMGNAAGAGAPAIVDGVTGAPATATPSRVGSIAPRVVRAAATAVDYANPPLKRPIMAGLNYLADKLTPEPIETPPAQALSANIPEGTWTGGVKTPAPVTGTPTEAAPVSTTAPGTPTGSPASAVAAPGPASESEIAQGLGYKDANQAISHLGPDVWRKTYQKISQEDLQARTGARAASAAPDPASTSAPKATAAPASVSDVIDNAISPTGATRMLNSMTKAKADFYIQRGNVDAAKQAIQEGAKSIVPSAGTALEDKTFQEMSQDDLARAGQSSWREKNAIRQAAESPATGKTEQAARLKAEDAARAAYEQTMQQEMPAFSRQGSPQSLAVELPPDTDLTAILQRSVALAKKSKIAPTRADTAPWGGAFSQPAGGGR